MQPEPSRESVEYDAPTWPGHSTAQPGYAPQPPNYAPQTSAQPAGSYAPAYPPHTPNYPNYPNYPNAAPQYAPQAAAYVQPPRYRRSHGLYGLGWLFRLAAGLLALAIGVLEMALLLRVGLLLFGANPDATFTNLIYTWTASWVAPFRGVFANYATPLGGVLDASAVLAMVVYALGERVVEMLLRMLARR